MDDSPQLTIGDVARRAGIATSSIRYYESIGLLPEPDRLHGQRRYDQQVLGKLAFVGVAQSAGFKLDEIKDLMVAVDGADGMGDRMRALSRRKLGEVEELLMRAQAMKGWLEAANSAHSVGVSQSHAFATSSQPFMARARASSTSTSPSFRRHSARI